MKTWTAFILVAVATVHQSAAFTSRAISSVRQHHPKTPTLAINMAIREATFGMGCFWEPAESLLKRPGILATNVGYAGAPPGKPPPTYDTVCFGNDWVEAVRVAYDDETLTYCELLDYFFEYQKPGYKRQYASVIFTNDASEAKEAKRWKEERSKVLTTKRKDGVSYDIVEIEPNSSFYRAEEYHQRYWEKQRLRGLLAIVLIAGESGVYNKYVDRFVGLNKVELIFGMSFDGICGAVFLAGAAWMLIERLVARNVRELKPGDLIAAVAKQK
jgi:peptide-methionine (S)-S-oxide reductase